MTRTPRTSIWVLILAGGEGRRLHSLTTGADGVSIPKQYCSLNGGPSLLQYSMRRAMRLVPRERVVVVVTEAHRRWWESELSALRRPNVIVQPSNRGTALGVLLPLLGITTSNPEAAVICLPSDHYVENEEMLAETLRQAVAPEAIDCDKVTLVGTPPYAPDSGFGYLCPKAADAGAGMRPVQRFVEKPDSELAAQLIRGGGVWSSGIFSGRIGQILALYAEQLPDLLQQLRSVVKCWPDLRVPSAELVSFYGRYPSLDFSSDVLQKQAARLQFLTAAPCGWSDVGTQARLARALRALPSLDEHFPATTPLQALNLSTALASRPAVLQQ